MSLHRYLHRHEPPQTGSDEPAPTILLLHGTGGSEDDLVPVARELLPAARLLSPRGDVLEDGQARFFRRLAEGVFDLEDLKLRVHAMADFVREASGAYGFAPDRVIALGYSNGANLAAGMLLLRPESLAAAALLRPMVPLEPDSPPDLTGVDVLIAAGENDPLVPPHLTRRLAELLRSCGADLTVTSSPTGHGLGPADFEALHTWFARQRA